MSTTWTLKDATGANLTHQPASGSPLALKFDSNGDAHLAGYSSELIFSCVATTDATTVAIDLTPDSSGDYLSQTRSNPTETPSAHNGALTWTDGSAGLTTLTFTIPSTSGTWEWSFGEAEPAVALRMKVKLIRD